MKNYIIYLMMLLVTLSFSNCEIDNYEARTPPSKGKYWMPMVICSKPNKGEAT